jgi:lipopolysaccharide/colanic/teichoic acid biosynthesis glycosyltransferase
MVLSKHINRWNFLLFVGDFFVFLISLTVGFILVISKNLWPSFWEFVYYNGTSLAMIGLPNLLVLYIADFYDHYRDFRLLENLSRAILTPLIGTLLVLLIFRFFPRPFIGRMFIEWQGLAFIWALALWRYSFSALALPIKLQRRVLIVGAGQAGRWIAEAIRQLPGCGLAIKGFVDDDPAKVGTAIDGYPVLDQSSMLQELVSQHKVGLVVVAITHKKSSDLLMSLNRLFMSGCQLIDIPSLYELLAGKIPIDHISDVWVYLNSLSNPKSYYPRTKRIIDLGLSCLGLVITWPLFIIAALAIKLDSPGPVLFRQSRLGQNGRPFQILKFRTMFTSAEGDIPKWVSRTDSRITRVGYFLRKMHLDELPQLINILKGEMSLIGPRAEWEVFARKSQELVAEWRLGRRASDPPGFKALLGYREQIPFYSYRLLVKPGVTGWAQVMFPYAGSSLEEMKEKLQFDLYYIKNMSFILDLAILMKTIRIVLFGHGK